MLELKAMTVAGATIPSSVQAKALAPFLRKGKTKRVRSMELEIFLENNGAPKDSGLRGADRLIQKLRKGGFIAKTGRMWRTTERGEKLLEAFESLEAVTRQGRE